MHLLKMGWLFAFALLIAGCATAPPVPAASPPSTRPAATTTAVEDPTITGTETLVFLRHGEKPATGLGQLTPQGLNRAIALSKVLPAKYGKPDFIFAPDPVMTRVSEGHSVYYYVRPLVTIEPTAILLGMPVQTPFGFSEIDKLNAELTNPKYAHATIFIAWEHGKEARAVINLVKQFGGNPSEVPPWHGKDYDSLFVVRIIRNAGRPTTVSFTLDHEGLDQLSTTMPSVPALPSDTPEFGKVKSSQSPPLSRD
jgi:broad specificity phosphatase PhoE